jgi:2,3-bisphosphoglycerate-independent phosphoglycerate mutase
LQYCFSSFFPLLYSSVTGDHSTPVLYGDHSFEPVPFVISILPMEKQCLHPTIQTLFDTDCTQNFNEIDASKGVLGRFPGSEVMPLIKRIVQLQEQVK